MGFTGADVKALLSEASRKAMREHKVKAIVSKSLKRQLCLESLTRSWLLLLFPSYCYWYLWICARYACQISTTNETLLVSERHIIEARATVSPAELRHLVSTDDAVSNASGFSSIVGLDPIVPLLRRCAIWPFQPEKAKAMMRFDTLVIPVDEQIWDT